MKKKVQLISYKKNYSSVYNYKSIIWYFVNELIMKNSLLPFSKLKILVLRCFGSQIGEGVTIKPGVNIKYPWNLYIGNDCWIGENVWIDNLAKIKIGNNVCISQGAMLLCGNHNYKKSSFDLIIGEICLENGSWVGAKSIVCPRVTLKSHSILSVNSVATNDLEPYTINQGNPAIKIREREIDS
jgi:putative colanic acid biosynthesis acetyltransferase WcaF